MLKAVQKKHEIALQRFVFFGLAEVLFLGIYHIQTYQVFSQFLKVVKNVCNKIVL